MLVCKSLEEMLRLTQLLSSRVQCITFLLREKAPTPTLGVGCSYETSDWMPKTHMHHLCSQQVGSVQKAIIVDFQWDHWWEKKCLLGWKVHPETVWVLDTDNNTYKLVFHNTMYYSEKQDYTFIYFFIYHAELKGSSTVWHSKLSISRWILKITEKNGRLLTKQLVRLNIIIKMFVEPAPLKHPCFIKTDVGEADVPSTSSRLSLQMCWRS